MVNMEIEKATTEVLRKIKKENLIIIKEGEKEAQTIISEAEEKARKIREEKEKEAHYEIQKNRQQELSFAELEAKKIIFNVKEELLDKVHNAALKRLTELPRKKREKMLKALIVSGTKDIAKGRIYANKEDADFVKTVTNLKFSEGIECTGGILIEKEDKTIRLDYRTEIILNEIWKNSLEEISRILFM